MFRCRWIAGREVASMWQEERWFEAHTLLAQRHRKARNPCGISAYRPHVPFPLGARPEQNMQSPGGTLHALATVKGQPRRAALIAATSIFFMSIIASNARLASSPPTASASVSTRGVICQEMPHLSLHQPQALSWPPLPTMAFQ